MKVCGWSAMISIERVRENTSPYLSPLRSVRSYLCSLQYIQLSRFLKVSLVQAGRNNPPVLRRAKFSLQAIANSYKRSPTAKFQIGDRTFKSPTTFDHTLPRVSSQAARATPQYSGFPARRLAKGASRLRQRQQRPRELARTHLSANAVTEFAIALR